MEDEEIIENEKDKDAKIQDDAQNLASWFEKLLAIFGSG